MSAFFVIPSEVHGALVKRALKDRGFDEEEIGWTVRLCEAAARHGIHTHNAIKALHLDTLFGSKVGGCIPGAKIEEKRGRFPAARVWNCNKKIGSAVAYPAVEVCIELADQYGTGMVSVDNAFHYFWGGAYVLEAARRGYIGYTNCTATLAEVVPYGGKSPALGTNPHSWAFPTTAVLGYPILVDWATSAVAMGRVQQLKREGKRLPPHSAVDAHGNPTDDPHAAVALLPFGAHKGYGLGLIDEILAGFIGGWIPSVRGRPNGKGEKNSTCFFFQVIHPEAVQCGPYQAKDLQANLDAIVRDIRGHGNEGVLFPGQIEAQWAERSGQANGLLFTAAEVEAFKTIAEECGMDPVPLEGLKTIEV